MAPNVANRHQFVPSLECIAEQEPRVIAVRRIRVHVDRHVEIPVFDINVYAPEPPKKAEISASFERILGQMDTFIGELKENGQKYRHMAKSVRQQILMEQAQRQLASQHDSFTDRDWYWYSEKTRTFVDVPISEYQPQKIDNSRKEEKCQEVAKEIVKEEPKAEDLFDLNADF